MHPGEHEIHRLVEAGIAVSAAPRPVLAYRKLAAAGKELVRYQSDYHNQYEVEMVFGTYDDPAWKDMKPGLSSITVLGWYKPFLPVYEIDHRAWRLYLIFRNCLDALLEFKGVRERRGFFGVFQGDMIYAKVSIAAALGAASENHLDACVQMKRRWRGSLPRMHESFTNDELAQCLIATLAVYGGVCRLAGIKPVFDQLVKNVDYLENLIKSGSESKWQEPRGFF